HRALVHRLDVDLHALEQPGGLLDAGQHPPMPVLGQGLQVDLGLDFLAIAPGVENLHGALEVDVGDLAGLDVGVGGRVKRLLRSWCHRCAGPPESAVNSYRVPRASQFGPLPEYPASHDPRALLRSACRRLHGRVLDLLADRLFTLRWARPSSPAWR